MNPEQIVTEFLRLVVAVDLDAACALVTDDIEYDNVPIGKNIGPDALRQFLAGMSGFQEIEFVTHRQVGAGQTVLNERTDRFRIGDRWLDLPVAGVFEVTEEGKVSLWRDYFDLGTFQTGMQRLTSA